MKNTEEMAINTREIFDFIEDTLNKSESILVHSARGQSRASTVISIYLMKKYSWTLLKTLEFLNSRRPDLEIRASFIQQLNCFENYLMKLSMGPRTHDWNQITENTFYIENEELLLRNTFLNAKMGPLVNYNEYHQGHNKPKIKRSLVWADENRYPLACENLDEDDLINKISVAPIVTHHQYHATQLKSSFSSAKGLPFGPKYTGEGKIDFYSQNKREKHFEEEKEDAPLYEIDVNLREPQRRGNSNGTRVNDLSSYNKNPHPHPKKHSKAEGAGQPQYQRAILGQADMNSQPVYSGMSGYMNQKENDSSYLDSKTMKSTSFHKDDSQQEEEGFNKSTNDPSNKYKNGPIKSKVPASGLPHSMAHKNKNMHAKINRGISPNQPPASMKNKARTTTKNYNNRIGKYPVKEQTDGQRRSNSLKVKEKDRIQYNKPSPSSRMNQKSGGSFLAPSGTTTKPERPRKPKGASSIGSSKSGYNKPSTNVSGSGSNGQYNYGSNYDNRNPGNSNFTANPRIRKTNNNPSTINNTMASFRSGPVKVVGKSTNAGRDKHQEESQKN